MNDTISRQNAIDAIRDNESENYITINNLIDKDVAVALLEDLPSAQPESTRTFVELVVEYPNPELCTYKEYKGKPYYSIKYIENGETHIGYGTYKPEVLSQFLKEYFIPSAQEEPRWITLGRPMNSGVYLVTLRQKFEGEEAYGVRIMRFINGNWMLPKHFPEWINEEIEQEVLAWRELPEPWKEGEADG